MANIAVPVVVFIHGVRSNKQSWASQERMLARLGVQTVSIDLPGHGGRQEETFTVEEALALIDDTVSRYGASNVILVGQSLGGYLAVEYAAHNDVKQVSPTQADSSRVLAIMAVKTLVIFYMIPLSFTFYFLNVSN